MGDKGHLMGVEKTTDWDMVIQGLDLAKESAKSAKFADGMEAPDLVKERTTEMLQVLLTINMHLHATVNLEEETENE